jgi:hypothetical protein
MNAVGSPTFINTTPFSATVSDVLSVNLLKFRQWGHPDRKGQSEEGIDFWIKTYIETTCMMSLLQTACQLQFQRKEKRDKIALYTSVQKKKIEAM